MADMESTQATTNRQKFAALRKAGANLQQVAREIGTGGHRESILHLSAAVVETIPGLIRKFQQFEKRRRKSRGIKDKSPYQHPTDWRL